MINAALFWSGGKDSALALYKIQLEKNYNIRFLVTTVNAGYGRISMHGVREELLDLQAKLTGIPLIKMKVPDVPDNAVYERELDNIYKQLKEKGIEAIVFGDIFLEDLREYREKLLHRAGLNGVFPLWRQSSENLIREFLLLGFKTILCCINTASLPKSFIGREINHSLVEELPDNVDPCGENGEFHTFCFAGPIFKHFIPVKTGELKYQPLLIETMDHGAETGFWYIDLVKDDKVKVL